MQFSIIIPVHNRPDQIEGLLNSLSQQTYPNSFEIIIVEDGSNITSKQVVTRFQNKLNVRYCYKENEGPGVARNYGMEKAQGDFLLLLDSDTLVPPHYLDAISQSLKTEKWDAFGGADMLYPKSTNIQKSINFCMTSLLTTGGTRGKKKHVGAFLPRGFNMGFSQKVFDRTKGFKISDFGGEDIDLSIRIRKENFKVEYIDQASVYHERKKSFYKFLRQCVLFGRVRTHISQVHKGSLKVFHTLPLFFCLFLWIGFSFLLVGYALYDRQVVNTGIFILVWYAFYLIAIFFSASIKHKSIAVGCYALWGGLILNTGYALGMVLEIINPIFKKATFT